MEERRIRLDRRATNGVPKGLWRQQCTATSHMSGERCKNWSTPGIYVCRFHGGGHARSKAAGARKLAELAVLGAGALARLAQSGSEKTQLEAATALIDRSGMSLVEICQMLDAEDKRRAKRRAQAKRRTAA